ncbi:MAG: hypothetical protein ACJ74Q_09795, partial [Pyrinomonadaceae bacterium]
MSKAHPLVGRRAALKLALVALTAAVALCFSLTRANAFSGGRKAGDKKKAEAVKSEEKKDDKRAELPTHYQEMVAKSYDLRFGQNPFAPSNAYSATGTFIPGSKFLPAARCAQCHTDTHAQWRQSAHGNA